MTPQNDPFILHFAREKPDELVGILSGANIADIAQLLAELPAASAADLAARLPSWQLSGLLNKLTPVRIKELLIAANTSDGVSIVAQLPEFRYAAILDGSDENEKSTLRRLFDFPSHSLASLAIPNFISVEAHLSCEEFSRRLTQNEDTRPYPIFVIDDQRKYLGRLFPQAIFPINNHKKPVRDVMTRVEALSGMTSAESALNSRLWTQYLDLAVVDSRHRLLGVVNRNLLQRVAGSHTRAEFSTERLFSELAVDYLNACSHLLESFLGRKS